MQTITRQYQVYKFDELPDQIKQKALDKYRDWNVNSWNENGWAEYILEQQEAGLSSMGFDNAKIYFSGFSSQGDGACFEASVNITQYIKNRRLGNKFRALLNQEECFSYSITHSGHYYHEHSMKVEQGFWGEPTEKAQTQAELLLELIEIEIVEIAKRIYKKLEEEYDYLTSDEAITESFLENGYDFTIDGEIFN